MKRFVLAAVVFSMLAAPAAQAQQLRHDGPARHQIEKQHAPSHVIKRKVVKKVVVKKPRWAKGKRLPAAYRKHVVRDYNRYRLNKPPRGYHWVRIDNNYLMVSIASGLIASLIAGR